MTQPLPPNTIMTLPPAGHPLQNAGGGTLHGDLAVQGNIYASTVTVQTDPTQPLQLATKQYVDARTFSLTWPIVAPNGARVNDPGTGSISVESSTQYTFISSLSGSHINANCYWDGTNWQVWNTAARSAQLIVTNNSLLYRTGGVGAAPGSISRFVIDDLNNTFDFYGAGGGLWLALTNPTMTLANAGSMTTPCIQLPYQFWINGFNSGGTSRPVLAWTGDNYNAIYCGDAGLLFTNYANTARIGTLDNSGVLTVNSDVHAGTSSNAASVWATAFRFGANGGSYYLTISGNNMQAVNMHVWSWGNLYLAANGGISLSWDGGSIVSSQNLRSANALICNGRLITNNWDIGWPNSLGGATRCSDRFNAYNVDYGWLNAFQATRNGDYTGTFNGWQGEWASSVDHANQYGLYLEPIKNPLSIVKAIDGVHYDHMSFNPDDTPMLREDGDYVVTRTYGFSASTVQRYLPELVACLPSGEPSALVLDKMGVVLWEAFKQYVEQTDARIAALEAQLDYRNGRVALAAD